jgi:cell wall-associated NlpC family hydrolase
MIEHSMQYLNTPYLWGGRSPFGIDCSGFTQIVFKLCDMKLNRDAYQQATQGTPVESIEKAKEKDLAFFKNDEGRIVHTGIILSGNKIIHASGKVHIDTIDEKGIFNGETKQHSHQLAAIRRFC